jgi:hypothetical protein
MHLYVELAPAATTRRPGNPTFTDGEGPRQAALLRQTEVVAQRRKQEKTQTENLIEHVIPEEQ